MRASGYGADVDLDRMTLRVKATGKVGRGALCAEEREVDLNKVTAVSYSDANMMKNGSLTLVDDRGKTLVHFRRKSRGEMQAMFDAISERIPSDAVGASTKGAALINEDRDAWTEKKRAEAESRHGDATPPPDA